MHPCDTVGRTALCAGFSSVVGEAATALITRLKYSLYIPFLHCTCDFFLCFTESFFIPLSDADCRKTRPIEFGYDVITACRLEVGAEDFEDCDGMR
jgi:hypothetical protein